MKLDLYYPDEMEPFIKQVKAKCSQKGVSLSQVILHLLKMYIEEDIYVPKEDEPRDALALKVIALFKEVCPNWKVPDISEQLFNKIVKALEKVRKGPDWWEKLFRKAVEIPWKDWEPDFFWLLDQDNHFKLLSGRYDFMIAARDREKHVEERRLKREAEKAEKQRIKQEEKERRAKEKEEAKLSKLSPKELEEKTEKERLERLEKERQERLEKSKHEPYWADFAYVDEKTGKEYGGWVYPNDWTEEQQLDWEEKHGMDDT
jgi:hypothetical protein